jgi:16S rRNA pseudouridine516 synthase
MRLDKFIANSTELSRALVHRAVKNGEIEVNGIRAKKASMAVSETDLVTLDGRRVKAPGPRYFMLHKPLGYVCATKDNEHNTVIDLIHEVNSDRLQIVGRLDIDTSGLVLLTDDGQWNHRITSPKSNCKKIYHVKTADVIEAHYAEAFENGIQLQGESRLTLPATLNTATDTDGSCKEAIVSLQEGKYHQVKRMFAALGNHVDELHRAQIGDIILDPDLEPGDYRELLESEINSVQ